MGNVKPETPVSKTEFKELNLIHRGKVRDLYEVDDKLLMVATDRISAFDVVMEDPVPNRITSYNVCYTKLLRNNCYHGAFTTWIKELLTERERFFQENVDAENLILQHARQSYNFV